ALPVDGGAGDVLRPAGGQHGVARDVDRLGAGLHDATHDDVLDHGRIDLVALDQRAEAFATQVDGVPAGKLAVALAPCGTDGIDDAGGGHGLLLCLAGPRCPQSLGGRAGSLTVRSSQSADHPAQIATTAYSGPSRRGARRGARPPSTAATRRDTGE